MSGVGRLKLKGVGLVGAGGKPSGGARPGAPAARPTSDAAGGAGGPREDATLTGAKRRRPDDDAPAVAGGGGAGGAPAAGAPAAMTGPSRAPGSGALVSSAMTVHGTETRFKAEIAVGDAIEVDGQVRIVKMVLGDASLGINAAFAPDVAELKRFYILKLPKAVVSAEAAEAAAAKRRADEARAATGRALPAAGAAAAASGDGYSREALLDSRAKQKRDKHC